MKGCLKFIIILGVLGFVGLYFLAKVGKTVGDKSREHAANKVEDPHGEQPLFAKNPIGDGYTIPSAVKRALRERLKDPDSMQVRSINSMEKATYEGKQCWQVVFTYSARNSFGGMMSAAAMCYMRGSELLAIQYYDE